MKKINKKVLKAVERVTRQEVVRGIDDWPPFCLGIFHQPKRPDGLKKMILRKNSMSKKKKKRAW